MSEEDANKMNDNEYEISREEFEILLRQLLECSKVILSMDQETYEILLEDCIATGG